MEVTAFWYAGYKLMKYVVYPYTWLVLFLLVQMVLVLGPWASRRLGWIRGLAVASFLIACTLGIPVISRSLMAPIEAEFPPFDSLAHKRFDAIVVLGGGAAGQGTLRPTNELSESSMARTICGADLYARGVATRLLLSGGDATAFGTGPEEAVEMKSLAIRLGVPADAIVLETHSRTTYESAVEMQRRLGQASIVLVTSASHIPRAVGLFKKQGLDVVPSPCGYFVKNYPVEWSLNPFDFLPQVSAVQMSTYAINELVGVWVYRLTGKL